jgi:hypothetical protein
VASLDDVDAGAGYQHHILREWDDVGIELPDCEIEETKSLVACYSPSEGVTVQRRLSVASAIFQSDYRYRLQPMQPVRELAHLIYARRIEPTGAISHADTCWLKTVGAVDGFWDRHPELCGEHLDVVGIAVCRWARQFAKAAGVQAIKRDMIVVQYEPLRVKYLGVDPTNGISDNYIVDWAFAVMHDLAPEKFTGHSFRSVNECPVVYGAYHPAQAGIVKFRDAIDALVAAGATYEDAYMATLVEFEVAE